MVGGAFVLRNFDQLLSACTPESWSKKNSLFPQFFFFLHLFSSFQPKQDRVPTCFQNLWNNFLAFFHGFKKVLNLRFNDLAYRQQGNDRYPLRELMASWSQFQITINTALHPIFVLYTSFLKLVSKNNIGKKQKSILTSKHDKREKQDFGSKKVFSLASTRKLIEIHNTFGSLCPNSLELSPK